MSAKKLGIIVGSLRKESYNKKVATVMASMFPAEYDVTFLDISDLPFYNEDLDTPAEVPPSWATFRDAVQAKDAYLFVTPEYNRSVSAVIKNALDVASRPYGENVWDGKVGAVVSVSTGAIGGFGANHHLRQSLAFVNVLTLQQPEAYLGSAPEFIAEDGSITNAGTLSYLQTIVDAFVALIEKNS